MRFNSQPRRCSIFALVAVGVFALFGSTADAQTQSAPGTPVSTAAPVATAPVVAQPAPGAPVANAPAPAARREETEVQTEAGAAHTTQPPATTPPPSGLATRVTTALASLRGQGATVEAMATRDREIADLRAQLTARDQMIQGLQTEVAQHRSDAAAIQAAVAAMEGQRATVTETVAALGFPLSRLPAQQDLDSATDNSPKGVYAEWQRLKKEGKPGEASAYRRQNDAQIRAYAATQPSEF